MSVPFDAAQARAWTDATLLQGDPSRRFGAVSIDTRTLPTSGGGALFVAIAGERHDAHGFLADALAAGAGGLLVERGRPLPEDLPEHLPVLAVPDTTTALGALARGHRSLFIGPLIGITGSNGKTSTKEMCAAILSVAAPCHKNEGNLNNEFGLPLTLLAREPHHQRVVVELGMNHRGEIARLAAIARPTVGVITNVGTAHIEFLGSREAIALEKGDLLAALGPDGVAVSNADDPLARAQTTRSKASRTLLFGLSEAAQVRAARPRAVGGAYAFELVTPEGSVPARVAGLADTAVMNALAASAAALGAGIELGEIALGLARYRPVPGRLEPIPLPGGGLIINDTYNANPQSLEVALRILARLSSENAAGRGIAVIGDMGELGDATEQAHREAGRLAASLQIDRLYAVGEHAALVAEGARAAGMPSERVAADPSWEQIGARLRADQREADQILVKGSRAMRMERIVELLTRVPEDRA